MTAIVPQTPVNGKVILWETVDIVAAGPDTLYVAKWAPHDFGPKTTIVKYTISTGSAVDHSTSYVAPDGKLQPWTSVTDLALNPAGGLFVSHDPTNAAPTARSSPTSPVKSPKIPIREGPARAGPSLFSEVDPPWGR
jgi:hypothetical protein